MSEGAKFYALGYEAGLHEAQAEIDRLLAHIDRLLARIDRDRPVVAAARAWHDGEPLSSFDLTTDLHEAVAALDAPTNLVR